MKTRTWILVLAAVFLALAGFVAWQYLGKQPVAAAQVWADGRLVETLDLSEDGEYRIETDRGWNLLTVSGGTAELDSEDHAVRSGEDMILSGGTLTISSRVRLSAGLR